MLNHEEIMLHEDMLCKEMKKISDEIKKAGGMTSGMLDADYKIIGSLYKLNKIKNEGGSSHNSYGRDGEWRAYGSYDNNSDSYGYGDDDYSGRMHYVRGHYSRDDAKNSMIERLEVMMNSANSERDRETIRNTINTLKSM